MMSDVAWFPVETSRPTMPADAVDAPVLVCLLGPFRLLKRGQPVALGSGGKTEALLSALALPGGRRLTRATLLSLLYPDQDIALAGQALNSLVYTLKKRLADALAGAPPVLHDDGGYWLNVEAGVATDVAAFESHAACGDQAARLGCMDMAALHYHRAAALYRGDLEAASDLCAVVERERLRIRCLTLLARLADLHFAQADYAACLEDAWRLLSRDPYREDAHRLVMQCYVRLGERAQALHQFRLCQDLLRAEFDAAPEPATVALFNQIRVAPECV